MPGPVPAEKAETPAPQHPTPDTYPEAETHRFLLVWFWTIFVFFSLGAAKLPTYIAPAYPAAALLVGKWLDRALRVAAGAREKRALLWGGIAATATAALLAAAVTIAPAFVPPSSPLPAPIARLALALTLTLLVGCAAACAYFSIGYIGKSSATARKAGVAALALTMLAFVGVASGPGYDAARKYVLGPYQYLALLARMKAPDGWPIVFYHIIPRRPSMLYYAPYSPLERKETPLLPFLRDFLPADTLNVIVITSRRSWEQELQPELAAAPEFTARLLAETGAETGGGWVMLRLQTRPPPQ